LIYSHSLLVRPTISTTDEFPQEMNIQRLHGD